MNPRFRHHDILRRFIEIAKYPSFSDAAHALNMTKGAISYQIKTLEADLNLNLFEREPRGVHLTREGLEILNSCSPQYQDIETALNRIKGGGIQALTVGMSSYFASRWLSPRLMTFMQKYPDIQLRIQPMTQLFDLALQGVDLAIRWGNGDWDDVDIAPFMPMPAWPVGNRKAAEKIRQIGLARAFSEFTLLRDHDNSNAWSDWLSAAGLPVQTRKDALIIPDPNVRVQAVIDGQGIALNDALVSRELETGEVVRLSNVELSSYGYFLAIPRGGKPIPALDAFTKWVQQQLP